MISGSSPVGSRQARPVLLLLSAWITAVVSEGGFVICQAQCSAAAAMTNANFACRSRAAVFLGL